MLYRPCTVVALALGAASVSSAAVLTSVNTYGAGTERCLVGDARGLCTGGGKYRGAFSITRIYETNSGRTLARVDDALDKVWTSPSGYIEVRSFAHYLSGDGTSIAGIGTTKANFTAFPAGTEMSPPDNRVVGPRVAGDKVLSDYAPARSFLNCDVGTDPFYFLYRSEGKTYSSNNFSGNGFDNVGGGVTDHMVTWNAGLDTDSRGNQAVLYVIAFERANVDDDFQDGVYEVRVPVAAPVPEPATFSLLAAGLCLLGWSVLRRRNWG
jgi:hypothetical protein